MYSDFLNNPIVHRFKFDLISENDIIAIIKQMEGKCSSGIDELSKKPLKPITCEISKPLAIIVNQSLETGICHEMSKIVKKQTNMPLYKKHHSSCFNNYVLAIRTLITTVTAVCIIIIMSLLSYIIKYKCKL